MLYLKRGEVLHSVFPNVLTTVTVLTTKLVKTVGQPKYNCSTVVVLSQYTKHVTPFLVMLTDLSSIHTYALLCFIQ